MLSTIWFLRTPSPANLNGSQMDVLLLLCPPFRKVPLISDILCVLGFPPSYFLLKSRVVEHKSNFSLVGNMVYHAQSSAVVVDASPIRYFEALVLHRADGEHTGSRESKLLLQRRPKK